MYFVDYICFEEFIGIPLRHGKFTIKDSKVEVRPISFLSYSALMLWKIYTLGSGAGFHLHILRNIILMNTSQVKAGSSSIFLAIEPNHGIDVNHYSLCTGYEFRKRTRMYLTQFFVP